LAYTTAWFGEEGKGRALGEESRGEIDKSSIFF